MARLDEALNRFQGAWTGFSFSQKVILSTIVLAVIVSLVVFSMWLRKPSFAVLFSDLDITNAGEVTQELEQMGEEYRVTRGGTTVLVEADRVAELRIGLASAGVIHPGGVGYEIFDNNEIGVTDFVQQLNLKRALEGELSRTISSLTAVEKARVHIVFSKESIFKQGNQDATASVVVGLKRGYSLNRTQIVGITNLVSFSVEGLSPENVTVLDQTGNTLTRTAADESLGFSNAQIDLKRNLEGYLAGKAEEMLAVVLGPGKAVVRVDADLDFRRIETTKEMFDPQTVVRSEQSTEESNSQEGSRSENITTNYDINKSVERIVGSGGGINSLSVAVFVDGHYQENGPDGQREYVALSSEELSELEEAVKGAVGFDPSRNDVIKIVNLPFYSTGLENVSGDGSIMEWLPGLIGKIATVCILVLLFLLVRKHLSQMLSQEATFPAFSAGPVAPGGSGPILTQAELSLEERTKNVSRSDPDQVVKLIKTWMAE
ncbi:MAG: flagellar M-ring protein FliF [Candidatus Krumholzibacteriota bacterium]|nr:flagellar M-ring protein FliF [Candidatus Krumholzibacteriota bacterium]